MTGQELAEIKRQLRAVGKVGGGLVVSLLSAYESAEKQVTELQEDNSNLRSEISEANSR